MGKPPKSKREGGEEKKKRGKKKKKKEGMRSDVCLLRLSGRVAEQGGTSSRTRLRVSERWEDGICYQERDMAKFLQS